MTEIAVVGAGFSGTLQAVHLLRAGDAQVTLIDRGPAFGRGIAYSTAYDGHLLNVRSANMSAFPDEPDHFTRWLGRHRPDAPEGFATRRNYGSYLADILDQAERDHPGRLRRLHQAATEIVPLAGRFRVAMEGGSRLSVDKVVLALGALPPRDPPGFADAGLSPDRYVADPWGMGLGDMLGPNDAVAVIGTGLTMVDVALQLIGRGLGNRIIALSRRGLMPRAHDGAGTPAPPPGEPAIPAGPPTALALLRHVRRRARAIGWRAAVDELRPVTQRLWEAAAAAEQRRFLRHLRPWWDVHRHRLAPEIAERLGGLIRDGRLVVEAGRLSGMEARGDGVALTWRARGTGAIERRHVRSVINCTGPQGDLGRTREPLLRLLLAGGHIRADALGLGIDVNGRSEAVDVRGRANRDLLVVGPMSRGAFWETVAVPDIRVQVQAVARALAGGERSVAPIPAPL